MWYLHEMQYGATLNTLWEKLREKNLLKEPKANDSKSEEKEMGTGFLERDMSP